MKGQSMIDNFLKRKKKNTSQEGDREKLPESILSKMAEKKTGTGLVGLADVMVHPPRNLENSAQKRPQLLNRTPSKLPQPPFPSLLQPASEKKTMQQRYLPLHLQTQQHKLHNDSSSNTVILDDLPNFASNQPQNPLKCPQNILIGPFDTIFSQQIQQKLQDLMTECSKDRIINFIKQMALSFKCNPNNMDIIQKIQDDTFWFIHMQFIIQTLLKNQHLINGRVRMLPYIGVTQKTELTRLQVFMLVSSMFLGLIPPQFHTKCTSFIELMTVRHQDSNQKNKPPLRLQKLKCVINYLSFMCQNPQVLDQSISIERAVNYDQQYLCESDTKLVKVEVRTGKIEQGYGEGIMVDFANKAVGGGFLNNGCAQQEILFSIFPEMSIIKLICQELNQEEALVIRGARRINDYNGYSYGFKYRRSYEGNHQTQKSVIVAVDAVDYNRGLMKKTMQFSKKFVRKQMRKFFVGIQQALVNQNPRYSLPYKVYTGRWGCGVFGADEYLKFCIQWMICSFLNVPMIFVTFDEKSQNELRIMARNLQKKSISDLLSLIDHYGKEPVLSQKGLLKYFKQFA